MNPNELPGRTREAEDVFLGLWQEREDPEALSALIDAAMVARRPMLAARLVGLLEPDPEEEPVITRARMAARMLLARPELVEGAEVEAFFSEWQEARERYMGRARRRQRALLSGQAERRSPRR